ncbi:hypothetical protein M378DRAFT_15687 [Amanita muscaria Koide BX008]|uniref:Eukaryotic translation initiation factor 3 subunit G n=1 Tax=Amanita muscaria (strain Koide BX008) TaxID=946122 RepID=A0A0C2WAH1_AMAMK|nr:hypothetical protein M378DRAFT_15687 [Amanita muscaria Koide BX008]
MAASAPKTSWADDVDDLDQGKVEDYVDENGIRTTVEYAINDEGKKVKVTRRIKRVLQKSVVEHTVAERQKWTKFGQEKGNKPGPDRATTTVGEELLLKLSQGNKANEPEPTPEDNAKKETGKSGTGKVLCRVCKGQHFTAKCPYKDKLAGLESSVLDEDTAPSDTAPAPAGPAPSTTGKYVPPSMRAGATRAGESMRGLANREDMPTLRVTNISEDTQESDLRELFGLFGKVARVYVGRDRETGAGKGFAFVSFEERSVAEKALEKVNGKGYDNLILSVQWSQPRPPQ